MTWNLSPEPLNYPMPKKPRISKEIKIASFATLLKESDKGCVLLVGGLFDLILEQIFEAAIAGNLANGDPPKNFFQKDLFGNMGPLSTFFGKINLAYAFGLINREQHEALHVIRDLRNEAAHCYFDFSFRDAGVVNHLKKLKNYDAKINEDRLMQFELVMKKASENMGKFHFVVCCHVILSELQDKYIAAIEKLIETRAAGENVVKR
jgi:DNA-binding MltR family transcriptional regulator